MTNNDKIVVQECMTDIIQKVVQYRRRVSGLIEAEYECQQTNLKEQSMLHRFSA